MTLVSLVLLAIRAFLMTEYAFNLVKAVSFGTVGLFGRLHRTSSAIPKVDSDRWHA